MAWKYCDTIERIRGEAIRVLEHDPEEARYRERVYTVEEGLEAIEGEVYA